MEARQCGTVNCFAFSAFLLLNRGFLRLAQLLSYISQVVYIDSFRKCDSSASLYCVLHSTTSLWDFLLDSVWCGSMNFNAYSGVNLVHLTYLFLEEPTLRWSIFHNQLWWSVCMLLLSREKVPFVSPTPNSKQILRAVNLNDIKLLRQLIADNNISEVSWWLWPFLSVGINSQSV